MDYKKIKNLLLLYSVHFILFVFVLYKLGSGLLFYLWGSIMTMLYVRIMED